MRLELGGVWRRYGEHRALAGVDLAFDRVHALALVGPSGGGKSTLLRLLGGLERADAGRVAVDGVEVPSGERELREYRKGIGTVFQAFNLFPHLTALENVVLPLEKVHGMRPAEAKEAAMAALERFRLGAHAGKKPGAMSGGQRQRVAIARAVAIRPRLLLFDEPTSALDPEMTAEVLDLIGELRGEGRDFVLVTHEMGFARAVSDRVAFLAEGRVVESGTAEEVFGSPRSAEARDFLARVLKY